MNRGFTIVELVISVGIFVAMTGLIVAKYGNFNKETLLTDTTYDIALVLRLAQTYGLSVKNVSTGSLQFGWPYGVAFNKSSAGVDCAGINLSQANIILFADSGANNVCDPTDTSINSYILTYGAKVTDHCAGTEASCTPYDSLFVTYKRPNPEAIICANGDCTHKYAKVSISSSDGSTRYVVVRQNGQISVEK